jgi:hypothetical protein
MTAFSNSLARPPNLGSQVVHEVAVKASDARHTWTISFFNEYAIARMSFRVASSTPCF